MDNTIEIYDLDNYNKSVLYSINDLPQIAHVYFSKEMTKVLTKNALKKGYKVLVTLKKITHSFLCGYEKCFYTDEEDGSQHFSETLFLIDKPHAIKILFEPITKKSIWVDFIKKSRLEKEIKPYRYHIEENLNENIVTIKKKKNSMSSNFMDIYKTVKGYGKM
ncbi:hypothetical protein A3Q56_03013 [Intoshia linei]|uniref:Uncharacterized protein n=1 Tax=Intoshia linei TaxID=1819745 RepID=A0A177B4J2_9BILA|nr:hypothetical protein A3Q56_03013 [Intoshia linei]